MDKINILFAGDFCIKGDGVNNLYKEKVDEISEIVKKETLKHDISVLNVETVFTDELSPIKKSGPALSSPVKALELLKKLGFTIGAFANNHVCDQGEEKGIASMKMVEELGMLTLGCGKNLDEANKPLRIEKKGRTISFLNFAENEFNPATESSFGFAPIDYYENARLIKREKETADFVFVMLHAGCEDCPFPRSGLKKLTHHYIDSGADAVIIAHPHTPLGYEYYNEKPIVYSMGNFFMSRAGKEKALWNTGYMVSLSICEDNSISFEPIPYEFDSHGEYFEFLEGDKKEKFIAYLDELCKLIKEISNTDYKKLEYAWSIIFMKASWEGFLEEMTHDMSPDGEYMRLNKNLFCCESHQEVMQNFFTILIENRIGEFEAEKEKIIKMMKVPF